MYRELNDYELLYLVCDYDNDFEIIILKYKPLINKIICKYKNITKKFGYEYDDLYQICLYVLYKTSKTYNELENSIFYTYLIKALENSMINVIKENSRDKRRILNECISYDILVPNSDITYLELFPDKKIKPFDKQILIYQQYIDIKNSLSFDMSCVFELMFEGFTKGEIMKLMCLSISDFYSIQNNIKKQIHYNKI